MRSRSPIESRLDFFELQADARTDFASIGQLINSYGPEALDKFYDKVAITPEAARFFPSSEMMKHASSKQMEHWRFIFQSTLNNEYYNRAENIGKVHARIGLDASLYFGAYAQILSVIIEKSVTKSALRWIPGIRQLARRIATLVRVALLDMDIAVTTIFRTKEDEQKRVIEQLGQGLQALAKGDLCVALPNLPKDYQQLGENFTETTASLRETIGAVAGSANAIRTGSGEIAQASEDLARRTESNAASLEETSAAITQMEDRLRATAAAAGRTVQRADGAMAVVDSGRSVADEAVQAMGRVSESAKGIDGVIEGLDKIAFQTRVLAMNAAVEAGRAGDAGRGFAVVADLVSALAMRSEEEAKRAREQLTATQTDIGTAVEAVQKVDGALQNISADVSQVHTLLNEIAAENQAQSSTITQISAAIGTMDQATQQNAAMVEETSAAARNLSSEVASLADRAAMFSIGETRTRTSPRPAPVGFKPIAAGAPALPLSARTTTDDWLDF